MPPLILAAKAIPNNLKAEKLHEYSMNIIKGLVEKKIKVVSYSCDGTETEHCGRGSESSEAVEVVWSCLVLSVDSLFGCVLFPNPFCLLGLPSAHLSPSRQAPSLLHVVMGVRFDT